MTRSSKYKVIREVKIQQLRMLPGQEYPVMIVGEMETVPSRDEKRQGDVTLMRVIDLDTGEIRQIVVGTVLRNVLHEEPGGYLNKCYLISCDEMDEEKGWRNYYLTEIENPAESADSNEEAES